MKPLRDVMGRLERNQSWSRAEVLLILSSTVIVLIAVLLLVEV